MHEKAAVASWLVGFGVEPRGFGRALRDATGRSPQRLRCQRASDAEVDQDRSAVPHEIPILLDEARDLQEQSLLVEATTTLERALTQCRALQPPEPKTLALVLGDLSSALVRQQQVPRARTLLTEALTLVTPGSLEDDQRLFQLHMVLAESYR